MHNENENDNRTLNDFTGKYKDGKTEIVLNYEFRFNVVKVGYEFRYLDKYTGKPKSKFQDLEDRHFNEIQHYLIENDLEIPEGKLFSFIKSPKCSPEFDPFKVYFNNLSFDGYDYIKDLAETVKTDDDELFYKTLKRYLIGSVDCLLNKTAVNDVCLVFQSEQQGTGKTRWFNTLLPKKFLQSYMKIGDINTSSKDDQEFLAMYWFINLDELEVLKGSKLDSMKSYITKSKVSHRKAYGKFNTHFIRRASFVGSVNNNKFLTDTTGNRRFLVFNVKEIDYEHKVDINGVWAQAHNLLLSGFRYWYNIEEINKLNKRNDEFRMQTQEEELLLLNFEFPDNHNDGEFLTSTEILERIINESPKLGGNLSSITMGRTLSKYVKTKNRKRPGGLNKFLVKFKEKQNTESPFNTNSETQIDEEKDMTIDEEKDELPF